MSALQALACCTHVATLSVSDGCTSTLFSSAAFTWRYVGLRPAASAACHTMAAAPATSGAAKLVPLQQRVAGQGQGGRGWLAGQGLRCAPGWLPMPGTNEIARGGQEANTCCETLPALAGTQQVAAKHSLVVVGSAHQGAANSLLGSVRNRLAVGYRPHVVPWGGQLNNCSRWDGERRSDGEHRVRLECACRSGRQWRGKARNWELISLYS